MSGFFGGDLAGAIGTWIAAAITLAVWSHLIGERRIFAYAQHLLAGLLTGYVAVVSIREVLVPLLVEPLAAAPRERPELLPAAALVGAVLGARYLPRPVVAVPVSLLIGGTAAFALGGAVAGTLAPQLASAVVPGQRGALALVEGIASLAIVVLVLLAFVHGVPRNRLVGRAASAGRWVLLAGLGGWFGYLLLGRLTLLVERLDFLISEWLRIR